MEFLRQRLHAVQPGEWIDLMPLLVNPLPVVVTGHLMGVPAHQQASTKGILCGEVARECQQEVSLQSDALLINKRQVSSLLYSFFLRMVTGACSPRIGL
jgi:hypothetical protein